MGDSLRSRIACRERTVGSWLNLGSEAVAEIMASAGFDWLVVDLEHSPTSLRETESLIRIAALKGVVPLVRVAANDPLLIKQALDTGAGGVVVPMVNSRVEADAAVSAAKYAPWGTRGVGLARAHGYGPGFEDYASTANAETIVVAQIEHRAAIEHLEEIQSVEGLDATMIGPYDLSGSIGKPGRYDDPEVRALLDHYETVSLRDSRPMGIHVVPPDHRLVLERFDLGYSLVAFSVDFLFLGELCRRELTALRGHSVA